MRDLEPLRNYLLSDISKNSLNNILNNSDKLEQIISDLYSLTEDKNPKIRWRSFWAFENLINENKELARPFLSDIIKKLSINLEDGVKRHSLKIIMLFNPEEYEMGKVVDVCFNILTKADESIANKANAMTIIYEISNYEPLLLNELKDSLELILEDKPSKGLKNRALKIITKINKRL